MLVTGDSRLVIIKPCRLKLVQTQSIKPVNLALQGERSRDFFCELDYTHHYCNEVNFMLTSVMIFD